jgi:hypothetical protein
MIAGRRIASLVCLALWFAGWGPAVRAVAQEGEAAPWEGATDVTLPPFLQDTGKRIVDQRPPPTDQQLEALRQLEEEVDRFTETGEAFRSTVTSLVRREYLQQRRERDRWYGEQLETEERAFNEARESSIRVFEDFIRRYPNHTKYTPTSSEARSTFRSCTTMRSPPAMPAISPQKTTCPRRRTSRQPSSSTRPWLAGSQPTNAPTASTT